jgi:uncharacterized membrane protein YdjX (TVP38/TMEM64 family)
MKETKSNNTQLYLLMLWMAIVPLASSAFITVLIFQNELAFQLFSIIQWGLLFLLSAVTMSLAITPTTYIALVSGYFVGFWGILPLVLAYQSASVIGFFLAKKMDRGFIEQMTKKHPKAAGMINQVEKNQFLLAILSRLSPALPFALMNVVLSASQIRLTHFFWGGLIGMLPRSIFFILVGIQASKLSDAFSEQGNLYITIIISLVVLLSFFKILNVKKP